MKRDSNRRPLPTGILSRVWIWIWLPVVLAMGWGKSWADPVPFAWKVAASWPGYPRGEPLDMAMNGNKVFVAMGDTGWISFDIGDAMHPRSLGYYDYGRFEYYLDLFGIWMSCYGIEVVANKAYTADGEGGMAIFDVSNEFSPKLLGHYRHEDIDAWWVRVEGNSAFLFDELGQVGLNVIDIQNPTQPERVGELLRPDWYIYNLSLANRFIYAADYAGNLTILDVRDPRKPREIAHHALEVEDVFLHAGKAYLTYWDEEAEEDSLAIWDLANPEQPRPEGMFHFSELHGMPERVFAWDNKAAITTGNSNLLLLDVQDSGRPRWLTQIQLAGDLLEVQAHQSNLCVLSTENLHLLQLEDSHRVVPRAALPLVGDAHDVTISGSHAYLADGVGGLRILDISDPLHPALVSSVKTTGTATAITVTNSLAFLLDSSKGLRIFDISSAANPRPVGFLALNQWLSAMVVHQQTVYLAADTNGLIMVDVSHPNQPRLVGQFVTGGNVSQVRLSGQQAILADRNLGVQIIEVANLSSPRLAGSYASRSMVDLDVEGRFIYALEFNKLLILEFDHSSQAKLRGQLELRGIPRSLQVRKGIAYIASGNYGLQIVNAQDPSHPFLITIQSTLGFAHGLMVSGEHIYVADGPMGLVLMEPDLNASQSPVILRSPESQNVPLGNLVSLRLYAQGALPMHYQWRKNGVDIPGATNDLIVIPSLTAADGGTYSVVASNRHGWVESSPALVAPQLDSWLVRDDFPSDQPIRAASGMGSSFNGRATLQEEEPLHAGKKGQKSLWMQWRPPTNGIATLSTAGSGLDTLLAVYQGGELTNLVDVAHDDDRGGYLCSRVQFNADSGVNYHIAVAGYGLYSARGVAIQAGYAFVADDQFGLLVYDLAQPDRPSLTGLLQNEDGGLHVDVKGPYAYLADDFGLKIIDVSDPADPLLSGAYDFSGWIEATDASGDLVCLAAGDDGLLILDVADPKNPKLISQFLPPDPWRGWMQDVKIVGKLVYVADWDGLFVMDISNPEEPALIASVPFDFDSGMNLQVLDHYVFMTTDYPALVIFDVQDPSNPIDVGFLELPFFSFSEYLPIQMSRDHAYIADAEAGVMYIVNLTDPEYPRLVASYRTSGTPLDVVIDKDFAYLAAGLSGLKVLDLREPGNPRPVGGVTGAFGHIVFSWDLEITPERLPEIRFQPARHTLAPLGERAELAVQVEPSNSSLQWLLNGRSIAGENRPALVRHPVIPRDAGTYRARVTAPNGRTVESDDALVEVMTTASQELEMVSAYKFPDLFSPSTATPLARFHLSSSPNQGGIGGTRWSYSPELEVPPVSFQDYGIIATSPRWFAFKPLLSGTYPLSTAGSEFRPLLAVFSNRFDLRLVALAVPEPGEEHAVARATVRAGQEYFILVASLDGKKGSIQLNWGAPTVVESALERWISKVANGHLVLTGPLLPGDYRLEAANAITPHSSWRWVTNIHCQGRLDFLDPEPAQREVQFYRIRPVQDDLPQNP